MKTTMICKTCGTPVSSIHGVCIACGSTEVIADSAEVAKDAVMTASKDALETVKMLVRDPAGNLSAVFFALGESRSCWVGILFGALFALSGVTICASNVLGQKMHSVSGFLGAAAACGVLIGCGRVVRHFYKLEGPLGRDIFLSGAVLLPVGCGLFLGAFFGAASPQLLTLFLMAGVSLSALMLQNGLISICGLSESRARLVVPMMIGLTALGASLFYKV
jgi:hypothetical protein